MGIMGVLKRKLTTIDWSQMGQESKYTPDIVSLQRKKFQLLFVYDAMQERQADFARLGHGARCLCPAVSGEQFSMHKKPTGWLTTVIPLRTNFTDAPRLPVHGELILIKTNQMMALDRHHENGVQFRRERVKVRLPYSANRWSIGYHGLFSEPVTQYGDADAWMFVGVQDYWMPFLDFSFKPCKQYRPNRDILNPYYAFNCTEYPDREPSTMP